METWTENAGAVCSSCSVGVSSEVTVHDLVATLLFYAGSTENLKIDSYYHMRGW